MIITRTNQSIATSNDEDDDDDLEDVDAARNGGSGSSGSGSGGGNGGVLNYQDLDNVDNDDDNDEEEMVTVLENISLTIPCGSLTAICGSTGAGKSTLLSGILGECKQLGGTTSVHGKVSFVAQSAW